MKHAGFGAAMLAASLVLGVTPAAAQEAEFGDWISGFAQEARGRGYGEDLVGSLFPPGTAPNSTAVRLSRTQPEFVRPVWEYLDSAVSDRRVSDGLARLAENERLLSAIEQRYGVSRHIVVAVWGLESAYGAVLGDHDAPTSLATLGWSGWRPDFVRGELFAILDILRDGEARRDQLRGSWAGAMGQTQFMPSSYRAYAVDWDGDGRKDLWSNTGDALASAANYLARHGWISGSAPAVEVELAPGFDWGSAEEAKTVREWLLSGAQRADHGQWNPDDVERTARLVAPAGAAGPAFLTLDNFRVIMRYNNSTSYALAISLLADRLAGGRGVIGEWPRTEPAMAVAEVEEMQALLTRLGHDTEGVDGVIGPNTRAAVRAFQSRSGMIPDGAVSADLLSRLRAAAQQ